MHVLNFLVTFLLLTTIQPSSCRLEEEGEEEVLGSTVGTLVLSLNKKSKFFRRPQIIHHWKEKSVKNIKIKVIKLMDSFRKIDY